MDSLRFPAAVARFVFERFATLRFERFPLGVGIVFSPLKESAAV
jgi:hypothetical protein